MHSRFDRAFVLIWDVDPRKISARIGNGVLTIVAPKYDVCVCVCVCGRPPVQRSSVC
jgi:hypothetical protein